MRFLSPNHFLFHNRTKYSIVALFSMIVLQLFSVSTLKAQASIFGEGEKPKTCYDFVKDKLPFYFFSYAQGGALVPPTDRVEGLDYGDQLSPITMNARCNIVAFPVLITGDVNQDPYRIWSDALTFVTDTLKLSATEKEAEKQKLLLLKAEEANARKLEAERFKKLKADAAGKTPEEFKEDSIQLAALIEKEKFTAKEESKKEVQSNSGSFINEAQLKSKGIPDSIITKMKSLGDKNGLRWLYEQQVLAGNVLFCVATTKIPIFLMKDKQEPLVEYMKVLEFWKTNFAAIYMNSALDEHLSIKEGADKYFNKYGKASLLLKDFEEHKKQYNFEVSQVYLK